MSSGCAPGREAAQKAPASRRYRVMVDDNFHYMDENERHEHGSYDTLNKALTACRAIVEKSVNDQLEDNPGITAERLFGRYRSFGDDPFILVVDGKDDRASEFSAWEYAKMVCEARCQQRE